MNRQQTTLKTSVSIDGVGLHSGIPVSARFHPAPPDTGLVFVRLDRDGVRIPARLPSAGTFDHATTLCVDGVSIGTVEHLLSAAAGEGLDNCIVEIDGPEVPILDGSALPFVRLLHAAGFERQEALVRPLAVGREVFVEKGDRSIRYVPGGDDLTIVYEIDFAHPYVGKQSLSWRVRSEDYAARIAPARTFGFLAEVEQLRARGLARGGSLQNCVVLDDAGILSGPLRFRDEFVRHKVLDLLGDLVLLGRPLTGRIHASKAGHALHVEFGRALEAALAETAAPETARAVPTRARR